MESINLMEFHVQVKLCQHNVEKTGEKSMHIFQDTLFTGLGLLFSWLQETPFRLGPSLLSYPNRESFLVCCMMTGESLEGRHT